MALWLGFVTCLTPINRERSGGGERERERTGGERQREIRERGRERER